MPFPLPLLDASAACRRLNALGTAGEPFLFFTNFDATRWFVQPLSAIDAARILYGLPGLTNAPTGGTTPPHTWTVQPPPFAAYERAFRRVKAGLDRGDSFLVNLTWATPVVTDLPQSALFHATRAPYRLTVVGAFSVFSPEPFVSIDATGIVRTFPMKGTLPDGDGARERLLADGKEAAEHATVVDLLRNDLNRVAEGVHVVRYRYCESIPTPQGDLLQTSSEIAGRLRPALHRRWGDILLPLLPAGSVTGAPKHRTVQLIRAAEPVERGFYTGVFGASDGTALQSAVMIRFVEIRPDGTWLFRSGGGITARSTARAEYEELLLKTHVPLS